MIPKIIHKIVITDDGKMPLFPRGLQDAINSFARVNPTYDVKIYTGDDCKRYIKEHFGPLELETYMSLKPHCFKSDFFRQLVLFKEGGWYSDLRQVCLLPLDIIDALEKEYYYSAELQFGRYCNNSFIGSIPKHPITGKMIRIMMHNVKEQHYGITALDITGPVPYKYALVDFNMMYPDKVFFGIYNEHTILFGEHVFIKRKYNDAIGGDNSDVVGMTSYVDMWDKRDVYTRPKSFEEME